MPLDWVEPEVAVRHNGKVIYHTYKNDMMQSGSSECWFTADPSRTDREDAEAFDYRELKAYEASPSDDYRDVLKLALETGEIEGDDSFEEAQASSVRKGRTDWVVVEFNLNTSSFAHPSEAVTVMQTCLTEQEAWSMAKDWADTVARQMNEKAGEDPPTVIPVSVEKVEHGFLIQETTTAPEVGEEYIFIKVVRVDLFELDTWKVEGQK